MVKMTITLGILVMIFCASCAGDQSTAQRIRQNPLIFHRLAVNWAIKHESPYEIILADCGRGAEPYLTPEDQRYCFVMYRKKINDKNLMIRNLLCSARLEKCIPM
jgi:hypothetical protein